MSCALASGLQSVKNKVQSEAELRETPSTCTILSRKKFIFLNETFSAKV